MRNKLATALILLKTSWINGFAYPISFWMWRLRQLIQIIISFSLWEAVFASTSTAFGYDKSHMLTYIFVASVMGWTVFCSATINVANVITSGDLSIFLLRPYSFYLYWVIRDIADKAQNLMFAAGELTLLYFIFRPNLALPESWVTVLATLLAAIGGSILYYYINLIFGFLAFWSPNVWAPRFLFFMLVQFIAGSFYPLDILPETLVKIFSFTPFPYFVYFQTQLWLEKLSPAQILNDSIIMIVWTVILAWITHIMWKKGVKSYGADGR